MRKHLILLFLGIGAVTQTIAAQSPEIKAWKSIRIMGVGMETATEVLRDNYYDGLSGSYEFIRLGIGFPPPLGFGIWSRLWVGPMSYGNPVLSVRATYSPFLLWKQWDDGLLKRARLDLFLDAGKNINYEEWCVKAGVSSSFTHSLFVLPIEAEAGWAYFWGRYYYNNYHRSGFYLSASTSVFELEKPMHHRDSFVNQNIRKRGDGPKVWVGFEAPTYASIISTSDFYEREASAIKLGIGFAPPIGLGIWAKIITMYESDLYGYGDIGALRLTYTPFMRWNRYKHGLYRSTRVDLFAETGTLILSSDPALRFGISGTFSLFPFFVPLSAEAGLAYY
jgi:hypothetical protein